MKYFSKTGAAVQGGGFHDVRGNALDGREVQKHGKPTAEDAGEDNAEFYQRRVAQPCLRLSAEKLYDLICHAVIGMPDPFPYYYIYRGGNQGGQDI